MEETQLRPSLPWQRLKPGTYAAETPTGQTYLVEKTEDGWRVILRGPRGGREVLGEPTRIKWVGQCRAEYHYQQSRTAAEPRASRKPPMPPPEKVAAAAATLKASKTPEAAPPRPASGPTRTASKTRDAPPTSRRRRRPPTQQTKPRSTPASSPLPAEVLAWKVSRQRGRDYHVAEHEGGLFKIIEVKGAEGFALFDEKTDGVVHEIRCGSLDACKQAAATMYADQGKGGSRKASKGASAKSGAGSNLRGEKIGDAAGKSEDRKETPAEGPCGCQHPEETQPSASEPAKPEVKPAATDKTERQAKIMAGLVSGLRKIKPPTVEA